MRLYLRYAIKALDISYDKLAKSKTEHNNETYSKGNVMFSFKWSYDYGKIKAIYNGDNWRQLNQSSAAIAHIIDEDDYIKIDKWYFNSYVTPIMMIKVVKRKSYSARAVITICVNDEYFGCSNTTIAQTNKFLDYVGAFMIFGYRYRDIKDALKKLKTRN